MRFDDDATLFLAQHSCSTSLQVWTRALHSPVCQNNRDTTQPLLQLMGKERNVPLAERNDKPLRFDNREVCKYNLAGLCPFDTLFANTKSYLGELAVPIAMHSHH